MEYETLNEKKGSRQHNFYGRCVCDIPLFFWGRIYTRAHLPRTRRKEHRANFPNPFASTNVYLHFTLYAIFP